MEPHGGPCERLAGYKQTHIMQLTHYNLCPRDLYTCMWRYMLKDENSSGIVLHYQIISHINNYKPAILGTAC